jgi:hypothetical protein
MVEARSGGLFLVMGAASLLLTVISTLTWVGAVAINDSAGSTGGLLFSLAFGTLLLLTIVAGRNVRLFATPELIGAVGPLGGIRTCPRAEFAEIRLVRHGDQFGTFIFWRFPTLNVRRRDGVDAFSTSAYLYRKDGLRDLAQYLGVPLGS